MFFLEGFPLRNSSDITVLVDLLSRFPFTSSALVLDSTASVSVPSSSSAALWLTWETEMQFVIACPRGKLLEDGRRFRKTAW